MDTKGYIDNLFLNYEETKDLKDFKEELKSNLDEKIKAFVNSGMSQQEAYNKATEELSDITIVADEINFNKKKELVSEMYLNPNKYMDKKRTALYVACFAIFVFGVIVSCVVFFDTRDVVGTVSTALVFCGSAILASAYLLLTQETKTHFPMTTKRALWYVFTIGVFIFGIFVFFITYTSTENLGPALATLIPFALPSVCVFVFLVLTEKDRRKPWVRDMAEKQMLRESERFSDPADAEKFGLISGAVWILGFAMCVVLIISGHQLYSWVALVIALVAQMITLAFFTSEKE